MSERPFFEVTVSEEEIARERRKAREMRKSQWWLSLLSRGVCHYCDGKFSRKDLTMDHVVPLARGGRSTRGNVVAACRACNRGKGLETPAERLMGDADSKGGETRGSMKSRS